MSNFCIATCIEQNLCDEITLFRSEGYVFVRKTVVDFYQTLSMLCK
jgi:hypothetical protein